MFITFEGIDFSGKSTQIALLQQRFEDEGMASVVVREPGGTVISERIRDLLLDNAHGDMDDVTEFLLFSASRSQLVREVILPALRTGIHVIADRFYDSSTAYQGYGRGLNLEDLLGVHHLATHQLVPNFTVFLDIPVEVSVARRAQREGSLDRMERGSMEFYRRVRDGYLTLAREYPDRINRIDGEKPVGEIADHVWRLVSSTLDAQSSKSKKD